LAQRRKRVFVIASARKDINCTKILFECDSLRRDTPPSRNSQQDLAATIEASLGRSRGAGTPIGGLVSPQKWPADITATLNTAFASKLGLENQHIDGGASLFVPEVLTLSSKQQALNTGDNIALTICANDHKEPQVVCVHGTQDPNTNNNVAHTLGRNNGQENAIYIPEVSPCIRAGNQYNNSDASLEAQMLVAYAFDSLSSNSMKSLNPHSGCRQTEIAKTLDTTIPCPSKNQGGIGVLQNNLEIAYGIPGNWIGRKPENGGNATEPPLELSPCLTVADVHGVAQAFQQNTRDEVRYIGGDGQIIGALAAESGAKQQNYIHSQMQVRRLTPKECERLQGFPDNYTLVPHNNKPAADSPRYKALGNSMAVPVMHWIGQRIQQHLKKEVAA